MEWDVLKTLPAEVILFGIAILLIRHFLLISEKNSEYYRKKDEDKSMYYRDKIDELIKEATTERNKLLAQMKDDRDVYISSLDQIVNKNMKKLDDLQYEVKKIRKIVSKKEE